MRNRLRSAVLALAAALVLGTSVAPALAVGPIQSQLTVYPQWNTYSASIVTMTPASSATDFFTITGSATKVVYVRTIGCTGVSTSAAAIAVSATVRSTADTLGTSTAPVVVPLDSTFPAGTAVVAAYTANPTLGTSVGIANVGLMQTLAPASTGVNGLFFNYLQKDGDQPIVLRGAAQQLALNAGAASFASGTALTCTVTWTER